ncbi:MAG: hypothetical protein NVS1B4_25690 [Gemmatimonadaceae bacterium]
MASRCAAFDWSTTSLGPSELWPQSLRTASEITLASLFPSVVLWGPELVQIYNDGYRALMGVKHPQGLGQPTRECWPEVWHINSLIYDRVLAGETVTLEDALFPTTRSGVLADSWFTLSYAPIRDESGSVAGVLVTVEETTGAIAARAHHEERERLIRQISGEHDRLAEIFRLAPSFIAVLRGPNHVFEFVNDAYCTMTGRRDFAGRTVDEAMPELRDQGFVSLLDKVLTTGEAFVGHEVPVQLRRGPDAPAEEIFVNFVYQPLIDADGSLSGIVAHGSDVTEQVRARRQVEQLLVESETARAALVAGEEERRVLLAQAEASRMDTEMARERADLANRAKSEFLTVMSHELRTPLNAIGGYAELIDLGVYGPVTAEQHLALERIHRSQGHLLGLINGVLNFAKVDAGAMLYEVEEIVLGDILAACEALTAPQVRDKRLNFRYDACDSRLTASADREKVQQILLNLIANAIKFTEAGGQVTMDCAPSGDGEIVIRVADTGCGIPADKIDAVFLPFVQVDAKLTRTKGGTGLGLSISRDLARGMGGDITVVSEPGVGSTFTLTLPSA